MMFFAILSKSFPFLMVSVSINGFICLGIFSSSYELGLELSFPIGEAMTAGLINSIANVIGFLVVMILTPVLDLQKKGSVAICMSVFVLMLFISLFLVYIVPLRLKRNEIKAKVTEDQARLKLTESNFLTFS